MVLHSALADLCFKLQQLFGLSEISVLDNHFTRGKIIKNTSSKPYQISFEHRPNYLYVYVSGEHDSYKISRQYWLEVADECNKTGYKKVLIDEDIKESVSVGEAFRIAAELPQMGFRGVCVAFFDRYAEQHELNEFGELVATNRGFFAKVFNDYNEAENWLLDRTDFNPGSQASDSMFHSNR